MKAGYFQGNSISKLGSQDIRFTRNKANTVIYALALGWPAEPILAKALGTSAPTNPGKIARVELIGTGEKVNWRQSAENLHVDLPKQYRPAVDYAAALKVTLA